MEDKDKQFGNYLGIVIQNNDPDQYGRVKVFIPHLAPISNPGWVSGGTDRALDSIMGGNVDDDSLEILNELKQILPWAEYAAPLVGEVSTGRFNNYNQIGTTSYANFLSNITATSAVTGGNAPTALYDEEIVFSDAFSTAELYANRPNPLSYSYLPNDYNNAARGSFSIPAVGAHVWVFFREGNVQFPVYFASFLGQQDWAGIFNSEGDVNYPGTYENRETAISADNPDVAAYRNKYVINQKGGLLEFVNTDLSEKVKLGHYSGSHLEMNNQATVELATANKNTLILNDKYETVNGFRNDFVQKDFDEIILRDKYKKVGNLDTAVVEEWKDIVGPIQEFKQLFEIQRTADNSIFSPDGFITVKRNSSLQVQTPIQSDPPGGFAVNPLANESFTTITGASNTAPAYVGEPDGDVELTGGGAEPGDSSPSVQGASPSTQDGSWEKEIRKDTLQALIDESLEDLTRVEKELGIGGSEIITITKHKVENVGLVMNDFGSTRLDPIGKLTNSEMEISPTVVYPNTEGTPLLEYVHVWDLPGGSSTLNVANRYNVLVGAGGLNLKSYGPTNITGSITNVAGEQVNIGSSNEINIDGTVVNISGDILRLRNKRQRQVLIDSSLGVAKNVIIGGGLHVEGEAYLQHVTAPREYQITETTSTGLESGKTFEASFAGVVVEGAEDAGEWNGTVTIIGSAPDVVSPHSHAFANLPLTLVDDNDALRTSATALNGDAARSGATGATNGKK